MTVRGVVALFAVAITLVVAAMLAWPALDRLPPPRPVAPQSPAAPTAAPS